MHWMGEMMAWESSKKFWLWLLLFWRFLGVCFWKLIPGIQIWWSTGYRQTQTYCSPSVPFTRTSVASLGFCTSRSKAADNCVRHNSPCRMLFALEPGWTACWKLLLPCEKNLHSPECWTLHAVTDPSFPDTDFIQRCRSSAEHVEVFHLPQGTAWNILVCSAKVTQSSQDPRQKSSQLQIKNTTSQRARSPIWPRKNLIIFLNWPWDAFI